MNSILLYSSIMYFYIFISFRNHFSLFNLSGDPDKIKYSKHKDHKFVCASEYRDFNGFFLALVFKKMSIGIQNIEILMDFFVAWIL